MLKLINHDDNRLKEISSEVPFESISSYEVQSLIDEMLQIARGERENLEKRVMVGLAAPQLGVNKRIILVDIGIGSSRKNPGELKAYINPSIIWRSDEEEIGRESCYSVLKGIHGAVYRAKKIRVKAYDRHQNLIEQEFFDFTARIFQHEIDHLNAIIFPERIKEKGALHIVKEEEFSFYKDHWYNWPKAENYPP